MKPIEYLIVLRSRWLVYIAVIGAALHQLAHYITGIPHGGW